MTVTLTGSSTTGYTVQQTQIVYVTEPGAVIYNSLAQAAVTLSDEGNLEYILGGSIYASFNDAILLSTANKSNFNTIWVQARVGNFFPTMTGST